MHHHSAGSPKKVARRVLAEAGNMELLTSDIHVGQLGEQGAIEKIVNLAEQMFMQDAHTVIVSFGPFGIWDFLFSKRTVNIFESKLRELLCAIRCMVKSSHSIKTVHFVVPNLLLHYPSHGVQKGAPRKVFNMSKFNSATWRAFRDIILHSNESNLVDACSNCSQSNSSNRVEIFGHWVDAYELALPRSDEFPFGDDGLHYTCQSAESTPVHDCVDMIKDKFHRRPDDIIWAIEQLALGKVCGLIPSW